MAGSKNNAAKRTKESSYKTIDGKVVTPVLYAGKALGHGKYIAGHLEGKLVMDSSGAKPLPYKAIIGDKRSKVSE